MFCYYVGGIKRHYRHNIFIQPNSFCDQLSYENVINNRMLHMLAFGRSESRDEVCNIHFATLSTATKCNSPFCVFPFSTYWIVLGVNLFLRSNVNFTPLRFSKATSFIILSPRRSQSVVCGVLAKFINTLCCKRIWMKIYEEVVFVWMRMGLTLILKISSVVVVVVCCWDE